MRGSLPFPSAPCRRAGPAQFPAILPAMRLKAGAARRDPCTGHSRVSGCTPDPGSFAAGAARLTAAPVQGQARQRGAGRTHAGRAGRRLGGHGPAARCAASQPAPSMVAACADAPWRRQICWGLSMLVSMRSCWPAAAQRPCRRRGACTACGRPARCRAGPAGGQPGLGRSARSAGGGLARAGAAAAVPAARCAPAGRAGRAVDAAGASCLQGLPSLLPMTWGAWQHGQHGQQRAARIRWTHAVGWLESTSMPPALSWPRRHRLSSHVHSRSSLEGLQVGEPDYDRRLAAFRALNAGLWAGLDDPSALALAHRCAADLRNAGDLPLRHAAASAAGQLIAAAAAGAAGGHRPHQNSAGLRIQDAGSRVWGALCLGAQAGELQALLWDAPLVWAQGRIAHVSGSRLQPLLQLGKSGHKHAHARSCCCCCWPCPAVAHAHEHAAGRL